MVVCVVSCLVAGRAVGCRGVHGVACRVGKVGGRGGRIHDPTTSPHSVVTGFGWSCAWQAVDGTAVCRPAGRGTGVGCSVAVLQFLRCGAAHTSINRYVDGDLLTTNSLTGAQSNQVAQLGAAPWSAFIGPSWLVCHSSCVILAHLFTGSHSSQWSASTASCCLLERVHCSSASFSDRKSVSTER